MCVNTFTLYSCVVLRTSRLALNYASVCMQKSEVCGSLSVSVLTCLPSFITPGSHGLTITLHAYNQLMVRVRGGLVVKQPYSQGFGCH